MSASIYAMLFNKHGFKIFLLPFFDVVNYLSSKQLLSQWMVEKMSCPLYEDFTRTCISQFKALVNFSDFDFCDSEKYVDCIFYKTITYPEKVCTFAKQCIEMHLDIPTGQFQMDINGLNQMAKHYCFSENRKNCAIYQRYQSGKEVSPFLHPDGTMIQAEA